MSLIRRLQTIIEEGRLIWEVAEPIIPAPVEELSEYEGVKGAKSSNILVYGDNLGIMKYYATEGLGGRIDLVYIDPPFFSKSDYKSEIKLETELGKTMPIIRQKAYKDSWEKGMDEYLKMLTARFYAIREMLSPKGTFWVHLDWHAVHYVKVILDEIFGEKNFVNEIIWNYKSGGVSKRRFARKHDTLLFYAKSKDYCFNPLEEKSYNRGYKPYRFKGVNEYKDDLGWYTLVNMKDVWQLDMVGRTSSERTGYATQKPEKLIERILESCTEEGDVCADFFAGSSTLAAVADRMKRRFIACDMGRLAVVNSEKRLINQGANFSLMDVTSRDLGDNSRFDIELIFAEQSVSAKLLNYDLPKGAEVPVASEHTSVIADVLKDDSLQLVDYWSVDFDYDSHRYKPDVCIYKDSGMIQAEATKLGVTGKRVAVRVVDIFGNSSFKVI